MFTGLVQQVGILKVREGSELVVSLPSPLEAPAIGESIAINGCCLTLVRDSANEVEFDVSDETWHRTAFHGLSIGSPLNIERAMRPIDRFGGHIVQGHVDAVGKLIEREPQGEFVRFRFQVPKDGEKYLVDKGSIAIDGISLTVVSPVEQEFDVWVIPHTLHQTNLSNLQAGSQVNLEYDLIARHVEKLLQYR